MWADLGRAPRTIDAYGLGLAAYLEVCEREGVDPVEADRAHIARYVRELSARPGKGGVNVVSIDSGAGLVAAIRLSGPVAGRPRHARHRDRHPSRRQGAPVAEVTRSNRYPPCRSTVQLPQFYS